MRNDCTIDNVKVIAPNASLLMGRGRIVKAGMCFVYKESVYSYRIARSLGRVNAPQSGECPAVKDHVLVMALSDDGRHGYERWIDPADITEVFESPTKMATFFFQPRLPYDAQTMRRLMAHGLTCERYIDGAANVVATWDKGGVA